MKFAPSLCIAALLAVAHASFNLSAAISQLPTCTNLCSVKLFGAAHCPLTDIQNCLCKNNTLQRDLFACVQKTCNLTEQIVSATVSQKLICDGVPQPSRSMEIIRALIIMTAITFPCIILRGVSRYLVTAFWWDDWIVLIGGILLIPLSVIPIYNGMKGFGDHMWNVPPQNFVIVQQLYYVSCILYVIVVILAKLSILFFYLRIFPGKRFRLMSKIAIATVACTGVGFGFAFTFQCTPVSGAWDISGNAKCINSNAMVYTGAVTSILEDFVVILLPIPQLKSLQLTLRKRAALIFLFALGSFGTFISMWRLRWLISYQLSHTIDPTYSNVDPVIWSLVEVYTAMICTSLMTLRPLLAKCFSGLFTTTSFGESKENSSWRTRFSFSRSLRSWGSNPGRGLPSQETIEEQRKESAQGGNEEGLQVWVENRITFEENVRSARP